MLAYAVIVVTVGENPQRCGSFRRENNTAFDCIAVVEIWGKQKLNADFCTEGIVVNKITVLYHPKP
jgi:hypothetical protein